MPELETGDDVEPYPPVAHVRTSIIAREPERFEVLIDLLEGTPWWMPGTDWVKCGLPTPGTWVIAREIADG